MSFEVGIVHSEPIYNQARIMVDSAPFRSRPPIVLNQSALPTLFDQATTEIDIDLQGPSIITTLAIPPDRRQQGDFGFYTSPRARRLRKLLQDNALTGREVELSVRNNRRAIQIIPLKDTAGRLAERFQTYLPPQIANFIIELGFTSRKTQRAVLRQRHQEETSPLIRNIAARQLIQATLTNIGNPEVRLRQSFPTHPVLGSLDRLAFYPTLEFYARTYQDVIRAFYQEAGLSAPDQKVVLTPDPNFS